MDKARTQPITLVENIKVTARDVNALYVPITTAQIEHNPLALVLSRTPTQVVYVAEKVGKKGAGRPTVMTKEVLDKLREAFMWSSSDREACLYAGISEDTLYKYQREKPGYIKYKEMLKMHPNINAKKNIAASIAKGDVDDSKWWAQNKMSDEFSPKAKIEHDVSVDTSPRDPESEALLKEFNTKHRALLEKKIANKMSKENKS